MKKSLFCENDGDVILFARVLTLYYVMQNSLYSVFIS